MVHVQPGDGCTLRLCRYIPMNDYRLERWGIDMKTLNMAMT